MRMTAFQRKGLIHAALAPRILFVDKGLQVTDTIAEPRYGEHPRDDSFCLCHPASSHQCTSELCSHPSKHPAKHPAKHPSYL